MDDVKWTRDQVLKINGSMQTKNRIIELCIYSFSSEFLRYSLSTYKKKHIKKGVSEIGFW
jgi:hypothetical protein